MTGPKDPEDPCADCKHKDIGGLDEPCSYCCRLEGIELNDNWEADE